jgi:hypothetical protein
VPVSRDLVAHGSPQNRIILDQQDPHDPFLSCYFPPFWPIVLTLTLQAVARGFRFPSA